MYASKHSNYEVLSLLDEKVYGHQQAKKVLINAVNRSKIRWQQIHNLGMKPNEAVPLKNVLLLGKSGTGKSWLVENLAEICDIPFIKFDATQITPAGGKGTLNVDEIIKEIQVHCAHIAAQSMGTYSVYEVMHSMVCLIDEADKLARSYDSSGNWNKQVQSNLLQLIDGKTEITGVTFVFAGAFADTIDAEEKKDKTTGIGFGNTSKEAKEKDWDDIIVNAGLIPELVGRMGAVVKLDELTKEDYNNILDQYILPQTYKNLMYYECLDFYLEKSKREGIIKKAMDSGQGVRMLRKEVQKLVEHYEFDFELARDRLLLEYTQDIQGE